MNSIVRPARLTWRAFAFSGWAVLLAPLGMSQLSPSAAWAGDGDNGGHGGGDDGGDGGGADDRGPDPSGRASRDITVRYADGWVERIVGGHYELMDDQSRTVVRRAATAGDFSRMAALR